MDKEDKIDLSPLTEKDRKLLEIERLHLYGSIPYTTQQLVLRQIKMNEFFQKLEEKIIQYEIKPEILLQTEEGNYLENEHSEDKGSLDDEEDDWFIEEDFPCCDKIDLELTWIRIRRAYTNLVNSTKEWKGCIEWSNAVHDAVKPFLGKCYFGKYVWRVSLYPFGMAWLEGAGGGKTIWKHHAFAVYPCNEIFGGPGTKVLDPYSFWEWWQTPDIEEWPEWKNKGNVWHAVDKPEHGNSAIYKYTMEFYCKNKNILTFGRSVCKLVRETMREDMTRYLKEAGITNQEVIEKELEDANLQIPNCCDQY